MSNIFKNAINVLAKKFISIATTFIRQSKNISRRNVEITARIITIAALNF